MSRDRGFRREQRERVIRNRRKLVKETDKSLSAFREEKAEYNRYNKRHPYDCGKTDCGVCHPHKANKACANKQKNVQGEIEEIIDKEVHDELCDDMCDFGD